MGEANDRGTFEERKAAAIKRDIAIARSRKNQVVESPKIGSKAVVGFALGLAIEARLRDSGVFILRPGRRY